MAITIQGNSYASAEDVLAAAKAGKFDLGDLTPTERQSLLTAQAPAHDGNVLTPDLGGSIIGDALKVDSFSDLATKISDPGLWKRIGVSAAGIALMYVGIWVIISNTKAGKAVTSSVTSIATKGVIS